MYGEVSLTKHWYVPASSKERAPNVTSGSDVTSAVVGVARTRENVKDAAMSISSATLIWHTKENLSPRAGVPNGMMLALTTGTVQK